MDAAEYLKPRYTFRQAAAATGFPVNTLRSNFQRGFFKSFGEGLHAGQGRAQRLCLGDLVVLAITSRLIAIGLRPIEAYQAGYTFGAVTRNRRGEPWRAPFQPFDREQYETILVWRGGVTGVVPMARSGAVQLTQLGLADPQGRAAAILSLNAVESALFAKLAMPVPELAP